MDTIGAAKITERQAKLSWKMLEGRVGVVVRQLRKVKYLYGEQLKEVAMSKLDEVDISPKRALLLRPPSKSSTVPQEAQETEKRWNFTADRSKLLQQRYVLLMGMDDHC